MGAWQMVLATIRLEFDRRLWVLQGLTVGLLAFVLAVRRTSGSSSRMGCSGLWRNSTAVAVALPPSPRTPLPGLRAP